MSAIALFPFVGPHYCCQGLCFEQNDHTPTTDHLLLDGQLGWGQTTPCKRPDWVQRSGVAILKIEQYTYRTSDVLITRKQIQSSCLFSPCILKEKFSVLSKGLWRRAYGRVHLESTEHVKYVSLIYTSAQCASIREAHVQGRLGIGSHKMMSEQVTEVTHSLSRDTERDKTVFKYESFPPFLSKQKTYYPVPSLS